MLDQKTSTTTSIKKQDIIMSGVLAITFKSYDEYNLFRDEVLKLFINSMNCEDQQMVV
jgi:hypothetical protein